MKTIYIADSNFNYLLLLNTWFRDKGFNTRTFSNSKSLFEALENNLPDLVLLDVHFENGATDKICREIKYRYHNEVMVMLLSGDPVTQKKQEFSSYADGMFYKHSILQHISRMMQITAN